VEILRSYLRIAMGGRSLAALGMTLALAMMLLLTGCASSNVSRTTAGSGDVVVQDTKGLFSGAENTSVADSYQNTTQTTKGAIVGGTVGGVTGALTKLGFLPGLAAGAILGAGYGAYVDANATQQDRLINRGATVVVLGDQILIVMPSWRLFQPASAKLKPQAFSTLKAMAQYINSYEKMLVKVSVYTNPNGPQNVDLALSQDQADAISRYLVAVGLDSRLLYAEGYGGTHLVQKKTDWGTGENDRVEVTLEKLYV
jgi:outer membrane protein OmpA-like peptidoglycan-associated protein